MKARRSKAGESSRVKTLVLSSLLIANALTIFILEAQLPPLVPLPGVKLGLANIITLIAIVLLGGREGTKVHLVRIFLGSLFTGQAVSFLYSFSGGLCCLGVMLLCYRIGGQRYLWLTSVLAAVAHIGGQLAAAVWVLQNVSIFLYTPILLFSSILAGLLTGLCVQAVLKKHPNLLRLGQGK